MLFMKKSVLVLGMVALVASACSATSEDTTSTTAQPVATSAEPPATSEASDTDVVPATTAPPAELGAQPALDITLPDELRVTPSQAEGPYYPVTKPDDRDNNLLVVAGGEPTTLGTPLELSGLLLYDDGTPIVGATLEIWQVDAEGIYDHPGAPDTEDRDPAFQFYGEAVTGGDGVWTFLTLDPAVYEPRPRHIHMKVIVDGAEVLTTQIYFDGDPLLDADGLAASAGDDLTLLTTNTTAGTLSNGQEGLVALHLIVLGR